MEQEVGFVVTEAGYTALAEAYWRAKIAEEIKAIDLSEAKEVSSDYYNGALRTRLVCAIVASGAK